MLRILLVLEDYGELMFLQTVLKKIGFDVDAIQNPRSFQDAVLRMNPDVLVMTAHGKRVRGLELTQNLKKSRGLPKVLLLRSSGSAPIEDPAVDMWRESPLAAIPLLDAISELSHLDKNVLHEKFSRLHIQETEQEYARVLKINEIGGETMDRGSGDERPWQNGDEPAPSEVALAPTSLSTEDRKERYRKFLAQPRPEKHGFSVKEVQSQVRELRQAEGSTSLDDLERQRRAFVEELFKRK